MNAELVSRPRRVAALLAATLALGLAGQLPDQPVPLPPDSRPTCASVTPSNT